MFYRLNKRIESYDAETRNYQYELQQCKASEKKRRFKENNRTKQANNELDRLKHEIQELNRR